MKNDIKKIDDNYEEGFTLIELLVVILIIGILAAIAIPVFLNQRKVAIDAGTQSDVANSGKVIAGKDKGLATIGDITESMPAFSQGTVITVNGTYENGYCVQGYNPGGNRNETNPVAYDSLAGGILKDEQSVKACPSNVLTVPMSGESVTPLPEGGTNTGLDATGSGSVDVNGVTYNVSWSLEMRTVVVMGYESERLYYKVVSDKPFNGSIFASSPHAGGGGSSGSTEKAIDGVAYLGAGMNENPDGSLAAPSPLTYFILYIDGKEYSGSFN